MTHHAWLHRLSDHMPHLHGRHSHSTISLPISTDSDNKWDLSVPEELVKGTTMTKISQKHHKQLTVSVDADEGRILYKSRVNGIIPIEAIKELRTGHEGSYHREQFSLPASYDERWITIVYIRDLEYKTVHFVAPTVDIFNLWDKNLRRLHAVRQGLMQGLGNLDVREQLWERMYWKGTDASGDRKLDVIEMRKLCHRLGVCMSEQEFQAVFKKADTQNKGYLEYPDFQRFVTVIKRRPEIESIYTKLCGPDNAVFDSSVFERFMREYQKSKLSDGELKSIFEHYTTVVTTPSETPEASVSAEPRTMTVDQFRAFLLSDNNSPFSEQGKGVWQDMNQPISEYYISSSHNTYLVGHQLVGVSTVEGYIRALLHSCRTVEMDIYDGTAGEPAVYHGNTLTSKVAVRDVCQAIAKYAFVTSPYPVMISAEVHCNIKQQDKMVEIMGEIFGDALIRAPVDGTPLKIDKLPSPNDLKYKILLKAKNPSINKELAASQAQRVAQVLAAEKAPTNANDTDYTSDGTSEETSEGTSDSGLVKSILRRVRRKRRAARHVPSPVTAPQPDVPNTGTGQSGSTAVAAVPTRDEKPQGSARPKLSEALASLLVYTVGVTCLGLGAAAHIDYAPEYMFSLSENAATRLMKSQTFDYGNEAPSPVVSNAESTEAGAVLETTGSGNVGKYTGVKTGMWELIKHNKDHLTRIYPKGTRVNSSNYEPHRYWAAGAQVVAINWQTFDLGYLINQSMFQRNGKSGYVLKPTPLRRADNEELLSKRTDHFLEITIISGQQLPRGGWKKGQDEVDTKSVIDPYVEVSLHIPDWTQSPFLPPITPGVSRETRRYSSPTEQATAAAQASSARTVSARTRAIKNNGFNPVWNEELCIPFDCVGGAEMQGVIFVNVKVGQDGKEASDDPIAEYCTPLGCLEHGFRHLPLHDSQLSQHLFATLFVQIKIRDAE